MISCIGGPTDLCIDHFKIDILKIAKNLRINSEKLQKQTKKAYELQNCYIILNIP